MAGFKSKRAMGAIKFNMPMVEKEPPVNILYKIDNGFYLVAFNKDAIDEFRRTYKDKEGAAWREYLDEEYIIYRRKLEVRGDLVTILKLKYTAHLDHS